jgi:Insecticide toxin TcdB middle/N-terminal region/FG-GAP-like repeat
MNGDGLADVMYLTEQWAKVWLGRGDGTFVYFNRVAYPWTSGVIEVANVQIADMDRDGIQDLIRISAGNVSYYPGLPDGSFWPVGRMVVRPAGDAVDSVVTIADANGNGSQDIVWSTPGGMWVLDMAGPTSAGMLTTIDNGMGKTTTFQYEGSGVLSIMDENAGNPWTYKLPISVPVPIYATIDPGAGGVLRVVRYGVRDGFWDGDERRFGGFLIGGKTVPAETAAQTYYEETRFYAGIGEDRVLRGKAYLVEQQDGAKHVFSRKKFAVEARPVKGLPPHPWTKKAATIVEDDYNLEGVSKPIETLSTFDYDDQVRLTDEHHSGRLDRTGDEKEVHRSYADSEYYWVRDKVYQESVYEANPKTLVSQTFTLYTDDGATVLDPKNAGKGWVRSQLRNTTSSAMSPGPTRAG